MSSPFNDRRASALLSRVREDISHLRQDVGNLVHHTAHHTLPEGARDLAGNARSRLVEGGHYAATRLRSLGDNPQKQAIGIIGGALVIGLLAAGIYALVKCDRAVVEKLEEEEALEDEIPA